MTNRDRRNELLAELADWIERGPVPGGEKKPCREVTISHGVHQAAAFVVDVRRTRPLGGRRVWS